VKLNHEELPKIHSTIRRRASDETTSADTAHGVYTILAESALPGICRGSLLISQQGLNEHPGLPDPGVGRVGAGDAFTAALVHEYMRGSTLAEMK